MLVYLGAGSQWAQGERGYTAPPPHNNSSLPASPFIKGPRGPAVALIRMTTPASRAMSPDRLFSLGGGVSKAWGWTTGAWGSSAEPGLCRGSGEHGHCRDLGRDQQAATENSPFLF